MGVWEEFYGDGKKGARRGKGKGAKKVSKAHFRNVDDSSLTRDRRSKGRRGGHINASGADPAERSQAERRA